ncbi:unnamed protein product (macronuclear) [Paramecium tetraurelia]|uniref:Uncharacterized protein n=1 Tax=Paramecium tetraurelia TaxID=5888 RepID=A0CY88_PARTE|nr:uncharacterized protein GSPATT00039093001 [Paramecium tetraurelia]CAK75755.1 unnamed protein product [Paramecium tetraurelia]|eukprot:XP_001443152.1 hypothetical protein (macronuclear) [Paramecium tetraurelia strain d4-2]
MKQPKFQKKVDATNRYLDINLTEIERVARNTVKPRLSYQPGSLEVKQSLLKRLINRQCCYKIQSNINNQNQRLLLCKINHQNICPALLQFITHDAQKMQLINSYSLDKKSTSLLAAKVINITILRSRQLCGYKQVEVYVLQQLINAEYTAGRQNQHSRDNQMKQAQAKVTKLQLVLSKSTQMKMAVAQCYKLRLELISITEASQQ